MLSWKYSVPFVDAFTNYLPFVFRQKVGSVIYIHSKMDKVLVRTVDPDRDSPKTKIEYRNQVLSGPKI